MTRKTLVFVYGTLRKGQHNASVLGASPYRGDARTARDYRLLHLGGFPAIVPVARPGAGAAIVGEVYECDARTMRDLDRLEGAPDFYYRTQVTLDTGDQAWIYILNRDNDNAAYPVIPSGDWLDKTGCDRVAPWDL